MARRRILDRGEGRGRVAALGAALWFLLFSLFLPALHTCEPWRSAGDPLRPAGAAASSPDGGTVHPQEDDDCVVCRLVLSGVALAVSPDAITPPPARVAAPPAVETPPARHAALPLPRGPPSSSSS